MPTLTLCLLAARFLAFRAYLPSWFLSLFISLNTPLLFCFASLLACLPCRSLETSICPFVWKYFSLGANSSVCLFNFVNGFFFLLCKIWNTMRKFDFKDFKEFNWPTLNLDEISPSTSSLEMLVQGCILPYVPCIRMPLFSLRYSWTSRRADAQASIEFSFYIWKQKRYAFS